VLSANKVAPASCEYTNPKERCRSWTGETANPRKNKLVIADGASFSCSRYGRATLDNDGPSTAVLNHG
jgi:hypothetical protein